MNGKDAFRLVLGIPQIPTSDDDASDSDRTASSKLLKHSNSCNPRLVRIVPEFMANFDDEVSTR